ncbi:TrbG/VirB9 family P-type conjugative transfer protein [Pseudochrobactrum sp. MP213Fo]|uniref:TrbG/VirB9 family P-type conjugative transfer protein n=1 Tax=Pseudochrobactrum sp. MP213Fo TaxID=3022250 RepID=UPI003B9F9AD1
MKRFLIAYAVSALFTLQGNAAQTPRPGHLDSRVTSVPYQENNVVQVSATYGISTMIIFDDDEKFQTISLGDTASWQVVPSEQENILFIKPVAKNVDTNMDIVTTKHVYFLELKDTPSTTPKVFGIRFIYPNKQNDDKLWNEAKRRAALPNLTGADMPHSNMNYAFSGDPVLKPDLIFDDGKKTFFKFTSKVPAIFAVNPDYSETLRNFRKEGEYLVLDGVSPQYTLRDGGQWVAIFNLKLPDFTPMGRSLLGEHSGILSSK